MIELEFRQVQHEFRELFDETCIRKMDVPTRRQAEHLLKSAKAFTQSFYPVLCSNIDTFLYMDELCSIVTHMTGGQKLP